MPVKLLDPGRGPGYPPLFPQSPVEKGLRPSWPKAHPRSRFFLSGLAMGCESGCRYPAGSRERNSGACSVPVMALDETIVNPLPRVCPVRSHSTCCLAEIPAHESIRPGHGEELAAEASSSFRYSETPLEPGSAPSSVAGNLQTAPGVQRVVHVKLAL